MKTDKVAEAEEKRKASNLPLGLAWFVKCLRLSFVFKGRACRREYWLFQLLGIIFSVAVSIEVIQQGDNSKSISLLLGLLSPYFIPFELLLYLAENFIDKLTVQLFTLFIGLGIHICLIAASISVGVRRMHDTGRSGWWLLVPLVADVLCLFNSQKGTNKYGPNPKGAE